MYEVPNTPGVPNSWPECYEMGIVIHRERNAKIIECIRDAKKPVLVFVQRIGHGELLADMAKDAGMTVPFLCGNDPSSVRMRTIKQLQTGKADSVIANVIWDEGVNIPAIRTLVLAGGGKSQIKTLQRLGRGLRLDEGKDTVEVIDFFDRSTRWLRQHSAAREKVWKSQGFVIKKKSI